MIDNSNPIFFKESMSNLLHYVGQHAFSLNYEAVDTPENKEAAEKLLVIKYFMAFVSDHFFGYNPAAYYLNDEQRQPYADFVDDLKSDPNRVVELLSLMVDGFEQIDHFEFPEGIWGIKPKRNELTEEAVLDFIREIYHNMDEFTRRLSTSPQNQDSTKPSEARLRNAISAIGKIQDYMLTQGEAHGQVVQAMQFADMLDMFRNPLLFAWEQLHYGWHSDFWNEG